MIQIGARADEMTLTALPVPSAYERVPTLAGRQHETGYNLAHAYVELYRDLNDGTRLTPDFAHAVHVHQLLARIQS